MVMQIWSKSLDKVQTWWWDHDQTDVTYIHLLLKNQNSVHEKWNWLNKHRWWRVKYEQSWCPGIKNLIIYLCPRLVITEKIISCATFYKTWIAHKECKVERRANSTTECDYLLPCVTCVHDGTSVCWYSCWHSEWLSGRYVRRSTVRHWYLCCVPIHGCVKSSMLTAIHPPPCSPEHTHAHHIMGLVQMPSYM